MSALEQNTKRTVYFLAAIVAFIAGSPLSPVLSETCASIVLFISTQKRCRRMTIVFINKTQSLCLLVCSSKFECSLAQIMQDASNTCNPTYFYYLWDLLKLFCIPVRCNVRSQNLLWRPASSVPLQMSIYMYSLSRAHYVKSST